MNRTTLRVGLAAAMLAIGTIAFAQAADLQPYPKKGQVIQRLNAFDNPEGSIFSGDGKYVFISNAAEIGMPDKGFHFTNKGGYISKLEVDRIIQRQGDGFPLDQSCVAYLRYLRRERRHGQQ